MNFLLMQRSIDASRVTVSLLFIVAALSGVVNILLAALLLQRGDNVRTVLVPPSIERTFWVEKDRASAQYLEQMGGYVAYLVGQVSPSTIDYQHRLVLEYAAPSEHGRLRLQMDEVAAKVKKESISRTFFPLSYLIDEVARTVTVTGQATTYVNQTQVTRQTSSIRVGFQIVQGKYYVVSVKDLPGGTSNDAEKTADPGKP